MDFLALLLSTTFYLLSSILLSTVSPVNTIFILPLSFFYLYLFLSCFTTSTSFSTSTSASSLTSLCGYQYGVRFSNISFYPSVRSDQIKVVRGVWGYLGWGENRGQRTVGDLQSPRIKCNIISDQISSDEGMRSDQISILPSC